MIHKIYNNRNGDFASDHANDDPPFFTYKNHTISSEATVANHLRGMLYIMNQWWESRPNFWVL